MAAPQTANLRVLDVERRPLDAAAYLGRPAQDTDVDTLITEPTLVRDAEWGEPVLVYLRLPDDFTALVAALRRLRMDRHTRTAGLPTTSRTFGFHPRNARRNNWCGQASLATEAPATHALLVEAAAVVRREYRRYSPLRYRRHERLAAGVRADWLLPGGVFTGGIVNRDNPLPYHTDTGNFRGVWSGMLGFRRDVHGGVLAVPAYGIGVEVADGSLTLFDGQGLLHGVTPFHWTSTQGYRFTIVYYALAQMGHCESREEEDKRRR
jgi:hypothetical protein